MSTSSKIIDSVNVFFPSHNVTLDSVINGKNHIGRIYMRKEVAAYSRFRYVDRSELYIKKARARSWEELTKSFNMSDEELKRFIFVYLNKARGLANYPALESKVSFE